MKLFLFSCLVTVLALSNGFDADDIVELEPKGEPFPGLKRGAIEDVIPKPGHEGRIINGHYACDQQIPYQAGLLIHFGTNNGYSWCGGVLIGNEWMLTAAHCISGAKSIEVRLGSVFSDRPLRTVWGLEVHIFKDWSKYGYDIAVVKIQRVEFNANINKASLPQRNGQYSEYVNSRAIVSGWGSINDDGQGSNHLKYVLMTVMDKDACARIYGPDAKRPSTICTNAKDRGNVCSGDSGGPLVLENTRTVIGIVSFGAANACTKGYPAGFARVTHYLDWINQVTGISY